MSAPLVESHLNNVCNLFVRVADHSIHRSMSNDDDDDNETNAVVAITPKDGVRCTATPCSIDSVKVTAIVPTGNMHNMYDPCV